MANLNVNIPLVGLEQPLGTVVDHFLLTLSDGQTQNVAGATPGPLTTTFIVLPGTYTLTAEARDAAGTTIGVPTVSAPVDVPVPTTVTVNVPGTPVLSL